MPSGSSPQNSQTNFVDLRHVICNFKTRENFSKGYIIWTIKISSTCLEIFMQNGKVGKGDVFLRKTFSLPYLHKNPDPALSRLH
jgi:hypothetical protein